MYHQAHIPDTSDGDLHRAAKSSGFRFDPSKFIVDDEAEFPALAPHEHLDAHQPHVDDASIFSFLEHKQEEATTYKDNEQRMSADEIVGS